MIISLHLFFLIYSLGLDSLELCTISRETDPNLQKNVCSLAINNALESVPEEEEVKVILFLMFLKCQVSSSQGRGFFFNFYKFVVSE